jgi:hypothetical protein
MTRAVIYARFSTDWQNEKSTEDQIALCRAHATRKGLEIVQTFEDKARSGGSIFGRDGLMRLMDAARARAFDVIVVEALDRLSRNMEDLAGIYNGCLSSGSRSMPFTTVRPIPFWSASAASSGRCSARTARKRCVEAWLASCVTGDMQAVGRTDIASSRAIVVN